MRGSEREFTRDSRKASRAHNTLRRSGRRSRPVMALSGWRFASEGGGSLGGALAGLIAAPFGGTARRGPGGWAALEPGVDFGLRPGAGVGAKHAARRETVALDATTQHRPRIDNAAVLQVAESEQANHGGA